MTDRQWVLDTNTLVSRLLVPSGTAARAVDAALSRGLLLVCEDILQELSAVLSRKKFDAYVSIAERQQFLRLLGGISRVVTITHRIQACRDPKDDKFLQLALNGEADAIVTGDADLLELHPFHGVPILRPAEFLAIDWA